MNIYRYMGSMLIPVCGFIVVVVIGYKIFEQYNYMYHNAQYADFYEDEYIDNVDIIIYKIGIDEESERNVLAELSISSYDAKRLVQSLNNVSYNHYVNSSPDICSFNNIPYENSEDFYAYFEYEIEILFKLRFASDIFYIDICDSEYSRLIELWDQTPDGIFAPDWRRAEADFRLRAFIDEIQNL